MLGLALLVSENIHTDSTFCKLSENVFRNLLVSVKSDFLYKSDNGAVPMLFLRRINDLSFEIFFETISISVVYVSESFSPVAAGKFSIITFQVVR